MWRPFGAAVRKMSEIFSPTDRACVRAGAKEAGGKGCRVMKDIALNLSNRNDGNTRDVSMVIKKKHRGEGNVFVAS